MILKIILLILLFAYPSFAQEKMAMNVGILGVTISGGGPFACTSYVGLFCEDFDGSTDCGDSSHTNCYATYETQSGTRDYNAASSSFDMHGTNCLQLEPNALVRDDTLWTATDPTYFLFKFRVSHICASYCELLNIYNASDYSVGILYTKVSGGFSVQVDGGTLANSANSKIAINTSYWMRVKYAKGGGANAEYHASIWNGVSWDAYITSTDGTATTNAAGLKIINGDGEAGCTAHFDTIKVSNAEFTNAPTTY